MLGFSNSSAALYVAFGITSIFVNVRGKSYKSTIGICTGCIAIIVIAVGTDRTTQIASLIAIPAMGAAKKEAVKPANKIEVKPAPKATAKAKAEAPKEDVWASLPNIVATINGKPVMKSEIIKMMMSNLLKGKNICT